MDAFLADINYDKKRNSNILAGHCELQQWSHALTRLGLHPHEVVTKMPGGKLPLHIACSNGAPAVFVLALASSYPSCLDMTDDDGMTPVHCACSCPDLALETLDALLRWSATLGKKEMTIQDSDGDTPLHSACRVTTSKEVLIRLVKANPVALHIRDNEMLTPLLRLWVRPFVLYGSEFLEAIKSEEDLAGELADLWEKTLMFLRALADPTKPFRILHTIVAHDCPRAILKIALNLYPEERHSRDTMGLSPLGVAIEAPVFKVRELTDEGFCYVADSTEDEGLLHDEDQDPNLVRKLGDQMHLVPSVIETLLEADPTRKNAVLGSVEGPALHKALKVGKGWTDGVSSLAAADPDKVQLKDSETSMYPFMLAASFCQTKATHVDTIYELLRLSPEFVKLGIPSSQCESFRYYVGMQSTIPRKRPFADISTSDDKYRFT